MATKVARTAKGQECTMPGADPRTDRHLLRRFAAEGEEAAFAALVLRHGPLVLSVCRRLLGDAHDAEDAFQATFLLLARQAGAIRKPDSLASWLYGVAYRLADKMRSQSARRRRLERTAPCPTPADPAAEVTWRELRAVLDEELSRLPDHYRVTFQLCYEEGNTQDEAARRLGWPRGTLKRRLERTRDLLRSRLMRRGITLSAALIGLGLAARMASASVPAPLLDDTLRAVATLPGAASGVVANEPASTFGMGERLANVLAVARAALLLSFLLALCFIPGGPAVLRSASGAEPPAATPLQETPQREAKDKDPRPQHAFPDYTTDPEAGPHVLGVLA
jgi:RNA polymerase sigma factor (sigma-70 family)